MTRQLKISTQHLDLIAATCQHLCAELQDPQELASLLNVQVPPGWPPGEYDRDAQEYFRDHLLEDGPSSVGWYLWYAIRRPTSDQPATMVGAGGFLGRPNENGEVEIGFSIVPAYREQGYAAELTKALVKYAFADPCTKKIIANTTQWNAASCKVLENSGFRRRPPCSEPALLQYELLPQQLSEP